MFSAVMLAAFMAQATPVDACFGRLFSCGGCYGCNGCYGCGGCNGCGGSCWGNRCWGSSRCWGRCSGCSGCFGCGGGAACHGSWCSGSGSVGTYACHGCYGCYGCTGCNGGFVPTQSAQPATSYHHYQPAAPAAQPVNQPAPTVDTAKLVVKLPADAKLFVDETQTATANKDVRHFRTPALAVGQEYTYTLRAEVVRDGRTYTDSKTVVVRAGTTLETAFDLPQTEVASK
ncbi:MAG TPA: TIGR03000 domain-containing protein [Gemmatales bacterium]|nr:TIGR03000 domain-containing protein [Gemmatales bacterium]HMP58385.1 TIGR03000 domain-containing protein [Gemmatales bacterium]